MPLSGHYCGDHHSRECECLRIRPDFPLTPEMVECLEVSQTYGPDVAAARSKQLQRNSERRRLNRERKRYEAIALERNMRRAADIIAERKLAEHVSQQEAGDQKAEVAQPMQAALAGPTPSHPAPKKPALSTERIPEEKKSLV